MKNFVFSCCFYSLLAIPLVIGALLMIMTMKEIQFKSNYSHLPQHSEMFAFEKRSYPNEKLLVIIAVETINLSETTRMLMVADYLTEKYSGVLEVKIIHYGGYGGHKYEDILHEHSNHDIVLMERGKWRSMEDIEHLYEVNRGNIFDDMLVSELFEERVRGELEFFSKHRPTLVIGGFCLSCKVSCQVANVPYFLTMPMMFFDIESSFLDYLLFLPESWRKDISFLVNKAIVYLVRKMTYQTNLPKRILLEDYNLFPKTRNFLNVLEGDVTLVTDLPEEKGWTEDMLQEAFGDGYHFVGPFFAKFKTEVPEDLQRKIDDCKSTNSKNNKIIYFAMGSSGRHEIVKNILETLDDHLAGNSTSRICLVIAPIIRLLPEGYLSEKELDPRIYLTQPTLPTDQVCQVSHFGILHGGQGTVQSAVAAGLPFVGVPSQVEQTLNIMGIVNRGGAVMIPMASALQSGEEVLEKLEYMMKNSIDFRDNSQQLSEMYQKYDAVKRIGELIMKDFGEDIARRTFNAHMKELKEGGGDDVFKQFHRPT